MSIPPVTPDSSAEIVVPRPAASTWTGKALAVLGDLGLVLIVVMALPLVIVVVGAPLALLVRVILAVVERF